jgi:tRNA dimethylallyltransferase
MQLQKTCLIITGPTAVGKTAHALELARKYNTKILSADSRQCYRELGIGVAKPTAAELHEIKHYFIDSHSIFEEVTAANYEVYALAALEEIFSNSDTAIVVGGTGLYIKALLQGLDEIPQPDPAIRKLVRENFETQGIEWLREEIKNTDPLFFASGEMQNPQRMMRALEVILTTGSSIRSFQSKGKKQRNFSHQIIQMELPRQELYNRINLRVDLMMEAGLLQEAQTLYPNKHLNALQTVGYKELFDYMDGKLSREQAVEEIKKNSRHYAKRQMTFFNRQTL